MKILDNITLTVKGDLRSSTQKGSKLSIAAACFSIYAYQELKEKQLNVQMKLNGELKRIRKELNDLL